MSPPPRSVSERGRSCIGEVGGSRTIEDCGAVVDRGAIGTSSPANLQGCGREFWAKP
jgi:hypothetical protein